MDEHTTGLLERAADDEATMRLAGIPEVPFGQHAQAAVEKLLKALINEFGQSYPLTHDLKKLTGKLTDLGETLPATPILIGSLTQYSMDLRYEESSQLPPPLDRQACFDTVEIIRTHVEARLRALGPRPSPPSVPP